RPCGPHRSVPVRCRLRAVAGRGRTVLHAHLQAVAVPLPEELRRRPALAAKLGHVGGVEQAAVDHHVDGVVAALDVLQRVAVHHRQVGALARLDRAQLPGEAKVVGAVDGGRAQRLPGREATLHQRPDLPVRGLALQLAVATDLDTDAGITQRLGGPGHLHVVVVPFRRQFAADVGIQALAREEALQARLVPDLAAGVPEALAAQATVADHQGRRVAHPGLPAQLQPAAVQRRHRDIVFDAADAAQAHAPVVADAAAAALHHQHAQLAGGAVDLLALLAARLVVALHREGAVGLHPAQVPAGIVQRVHHRLEVAVGAVKDGAGGEDPRADHPAGLDQLGLREHELGGGRGIVQGGDAVGQVGVVGPVALRDHALAEVGGVRVHVDDAGEHRLAAHVDFAGAGRDGHLTAATNGSDALATHQHHAILDHFLAVLGIAHGDHAAADQGEAFVRAVGRHGQADRHAGIGLAGVDGAA